MQYKSQVSPECDCEVSAQNTPQIIYYNPKSEKVGTVWKTQIKKESSDF